MKRTDTFKWTPKAVAAFKEIKRYLASPPIMVAPQPREPVLLYLVATPHTASAVLVAEREEPIPTVEDTSTPPGPKLPFESTPTPTGLEISTENPPQASPY